MFRSAGGTRRNVAPADVNRAPRSRPRGRRRLAGPWSCPSPRARRAPGARRRPRPGRGRGAPGRTVVLWTPAKLSPAIIGTNPRRARRSASVSAIISPTPRRRPALVEALLQDRVRRVLDLGPRRDVRHPADHRDRVEEYLRVRRLRGRVQERLRLGHRHERRDGAARLATIGAPSGPSANSTNLQAASLFSDALVMQYASECRMPAGSARAAAGRRPSRNP